MITSYYNFLNGYFDRVMCAPKFIFISWKMFLWFFFSLIRTEIIVTSKWKHSVFGYMQMRKRFTLTRIAYPSNGRYMWKYLYGRRMVCYKWCDLVYVQSFFDCKNLLRKPRTLLIEFIIVFNRLFFCFIVRVIAVWMFQKNKSLKTFYTLLPYLYKHTRTTSASLKFDSYLNTDR